MGINPSQASLPFARVLRAHVIFAAVTTLYIAAFGRVPVNVAVAVVAIETIGVLAYGAWLGRHWHGRTLRQYAITAFTLGLTLWLGQVTVVIIRYGAAANNAWLFLRVVLFGSLLGLGGAVLGDLAARHHLTLNNAMIGIGISIAGLLVSIMQLFT